MNRGVMSGHIAQDLERKYTTKGEVYVAVAIAADVPGEPGEPGKPKGMGTTFIDFRVFGARAEALMRHCAKGTRIWVEYHLQTHRWTTKQGEKRKELGVIPKNIEWDPKRGGGNTDE